MLNPELLRRDPDRTRAVLARRDEDAVKAFDEAIVVDEEWRRTTAEVEALRAERKHRSATRRGRPSDEQVKEDRLLGERLSLLERELKAVEEKRKIALAWILKRWKKWSDQNGVFEDAYPVDHILTNATIYWVNQAIGTSIRAYRNANLYPWTPSHHRQPPIEAPAGFTFLLGDASPPGAHTPEQRIAIFKAGGGRLYIKIVDITEPLPMIISKVDDRRLVDLARRKHRVSKPVSHVVFCPVDNSSGQSLVIFAFGLKQT